MSDVITFGGLEISFDDHVLRPRPWTIEQSRWAVDLLGEAPAGRVLELFAGVGHIGLAAVGGTGRDLVLVDLNPVACLHARRNIDVAGLGKRVEVREGRIDQVLDPDERFALVIADPPWVPSSGIGEFPADPSIAIDGGTDGLDLARTACTVIERHLADGGSAVLQLGTVEQSAAIGSHLDDAGHALSVVETRCFDDGVLVRLSR